MKTRKSLAVRLAVTVMAAILLGGLLGVLPASAADDWSWANYGFSGSAIANPDPFDKSSYLIGGYVATINHQYPLAESYVYNASIILDTEGVAIRLRFSWANTEPGYKAVADLSDGIAIYPMDESLDIAVVTESGVKRFSFPVPAAYDYMKANEFQVMDNGSYMSVSVAGKTVAALRFSEPRTVLGKTCYGNVTVTDGNGYVYGRITDSLVLESGGYAGYSSQNDRALILVKAHSLAAADIAFDAIPEEKETTEGWVPETEPRETEPESVPVTETEAETAPVAESETEAVTEPVAEDTVPATDAPETLPASEAETDTSDGGCGGMIGAGAAILMSATAAAFVLGRKND